MKQMAEKAPKSAKNLAERDSITDNSHEKLAKGDLETPTTREDTKTGDGRENPDKLTDEGAKDLSFQSFVGADLTGADFEGANLRRAIFDGADLEGANLAGADMRNGSFIGANLMKVALDGADMRGARFQRAKLSLSNMQDAKLKGADMRGVRGRYAVWRRADWWNARMDDSLTKALSKKWPRAKNE